MTADKILVVIPAFNEAENIQKTVAEVFHCGQAVSVLVVDDGSADLTSAEAALAGAEVVRLPFNLGIGGAVQTGFKYARDNGFDIMIQVDGDNQHDAAYLKDLLAPVITGEADMTIGSRFLSVQKGFQSSFARRIGINFFVGLISMLTGHKITDPTSGFRAFNKKLINVFARYYPQDFPEPEAIAVASRYKAVIREVPVIMRKRSGGKSSIRDIKTLYYMIKVTFAILLDKFKHTSKELVSCR
ncbi:MAG: glycosyltransferase family 2 protein [Candidatus Omnitrophica bacterium]|nr:glycosyltransferase family 2 protein [Candidatus Omnitrophota bacterium]